MQIAAIGWCTEVANARSSRALEGASPQSVFDAIDAEALEPLPVQGFVLATWATCKVGPDIRARVDGTLYSIPWRWIGKSLDARSTATMVQFFHRGGLVKTHARKQRGKQTDYGDYPPEKIAFHMRRPDLVPQAGRADRLADCCGDRRAAGRERAPFRLRAAQGILGLADKHQPERLEAACAKAIAAGEPSYRTIMGILAAGLCAGDPNQHRGAAHPTAPADRRAPGEPSGPAAALAVLPASATG